MDNVYDIFMGSQIVGQARVQRQGLYYHFHCQCKISGTVIYRIAVSCGGHHENLGILIPAGDQFSLSKKIPVKNLGKGIMQFRALPKHQKEHGQFVPLIPDEPFRYITRLQNSFLEIRNGQVGVVLSEGISNSSPTGQ